MDLTPEECYRFWRDQRECGELSKKIPIQSKFALYASKEESSPYYSDSNSDPNFVAASSQYIPQQKNTLPQWNPSNMAHKIMNMLPPAVNNQNVKSTQKTIDNLILFSSSQPQKQMSPITISDSPTMNMISSKKTIIIHEQEDEPKRNPFLSAKEQFKKDGGNIKDLKTTSSSSTTSTGKVLNSVVNKSSNSKEDDQSELPEELQQFEKHLIDKIEADIIHKGQPVTFEDIAGLDKVKQSVIELICWPMSRPDLFKGLRALVSFNLFQIRLFFSLI